MENKRMIVLITSILALYSFSGLLQAYPTHLTIKNDTDRELIFSVVRTPINPTSGREVYPAYGSRDARLMVHLGAHATRAVENLDREAISISIIKYEPILVPYDETKVLFQNPIGSDKHGKPIFPPKPKSVYKTIETEHAKLEFSEEDSDNMIVSYDGTQWSWSTPPTYGERAYAAALAAKRATVERLAQTRSWLSSWWNSVKAKLFGR